MRPHGRTKYVVEKCHCRVCRQDAAEYESNRRRQIAYGRHRPYVDAEPARQHIRRLQAAGMGWKRVAELAGLNSSVLWKLLYGDRSRFDGPSKRIRPETERKILAVEATLDTLGGAVGVDATGARRRLQALVANGWSQSKLCLRLGLQRSNFTGTMRRERLHVATVKAVRELYDELWNQAPPEGTHRDRIAASRARNYAKQHGWVPPLAWDDDTIDDPDAQPEGAGLDRRGNSKLPPADELRWLISQGETESTIALRFGVRAGSVTQALTREGVAA